MCVCVCVCRGAMARQTPEAIHAIVGLGAIQLSDTSAVVDLREDHGTLRAAAREGQTAHSQMDLVARPGRRGAHAVLRHLQGSSIGALQDVEDCAFPANPPPKKGRKGIRTPKVSCTPPKENQWGERGGGGEGFHAQQQHPITPVKRSHAAVSMSSRMKEGKGRTVQKYLQVLARPTSPQTVTVQRGQDYRQASGGGVAQDIMGVEGIEEMWAVKEKDSNRQVSMSAKHPKRLVLKAEGEAGSSTVMTLLSLSIFIVSDTLSLSLSVSPARHLVARSFCKDVGCHHQQRTCQNTPLCQIEEMSGCDANFHKRHEQETRERFPGLPIAEGVTIGVVFFSKGKEFFFGRRGETRPPPVPPAVGRDFSPCYCKMPIIPQCSHLEEPPSPSPPALPVGDHVRCWLLVSAVQGQESPR